MKQSSTESPDSVTGNAARSSRFVVDFASVRRFTPPSQESRVSPSWGGVRHLVVDDAAQPV